MKDEQRAAFEVWDRRYGTASASYERIHGSYGQLSVAQRCDAWQAAYASRDAEVKRLRDALTSFIFEFGDKTNSATVNKARAALKEPQ